METQTSETSTPATSTQNYRCSHCDAIFPDERQILPHIRRAHPTEPGFFELTDAPANRPSADSWRKRAAAKQANKDLVGPFKCLFCGFKARNMRGIGVHVGTAHRDERPKKEPMLAGRDFEALGTGKPLPKKRIGYNKRLPDGVGAEKPICNIIVPLNDKIKIRVPLLLGPPVFIERNGDGK